MHNRFVTHVRTLVLTLAAAAFGIGLFAAPAALAQSGGGSGAIVIVSIESPGGARHALQATNISVSEDGSEVTVTIRDPECPEKTSKITVNVRRQRITGHSGDPCHDYTGWRVRGIMRIEKKDATADADAAAADGDS